MQCNFQNAQNLAINKLPFYNLMASIGKSPGKPTVHEMRNLVKQINDITIPIQKPDDRSSVLH